MSTALSMRAAGGSEWHPFTCARSVSLHIPMYRVPNLAQAVALCIFSPLAIPMSEKNMTSNKGCVIFTCEIGITWELQGKGERFGSRREKKNVSGLHS